MRLKLSDAIMVLEKENEYLFCSEDKKITLTKNEIVTSRVKELLMIKGIDINLAEKGDWVKFCKVLYRNRFLLDVEDIEGKLSEVDYCNYKFLSYRRNNAICIQNELKSKRVLIVGIGGIGQVALQHLVASGFRTFEFIDFDVVKKSNFNRQFLTDGTQLEHKKTISVYENLKKSYENLEIGIHNVPINNEEDLRWIFDNIKKPDMILCAADRPSNEIIRKIVVKKSVEEEIPCALSGVGVLYGEVGPLLISSMAKEHYLNYLDFNKGTIYNPILEGSICYTNSLVAVLIAYEIYKYFVEQDKLSVVDKTLIYDLSSMKRIKEIDWKRDDIIHK